MITEHEPTPEEEYGEMIHHAPFMQEIIQHEAREENVKQTKAQFWKIIDQMSELAETEEGLERNIWRFALECKREIQRILEL